MGTTEIRKARAELAQRLFPQGLPRLWCPTLTHFSATGQFDEHRLRSHWQHLAPHVKGVLVPGSTGEGWEMNDGDIQRLLATTIPIAEAAGIRILIGVLKTDLPGMLRCLDAAMTFLQQHTGGREPHQILERANVVGFTVCPPKGSDLDQDALSHALSRILERGLPIALYQLPQVTGNELDAQTVQALAERYPNFYLFKDTSGNDRVAQSRFDFAGVFLVRGAEGNYASWPKLTGGPYDGFLLSTANVFAREYDALLRLLDEGRKDKAGSLARRMEAVVEGCFSLVCGFPTGNAFTNANKVLDHLMAHGQAGLRREPPLLYSGVRLPAAFVEGAAALLQQHDLMPPHGYLE
jgi:dihydrodipicolinate synthase/N-acetylneuraminate lyase